MKTTFGSETKPHPTRRSDGRPPTPAAAEAAFLADIDANVTDASLPLVKYGQGRGETTMGDEAAAMPPHPKVEKANKTACDALDKAWTQLTLAASVKASGPVESSYLIGFVASMRAVGVPYHIAYRVIDHQLNSLEGACNGTPSLR